MREHGDAGRKGREMAEERGMADDGGRKVIEERRERKDEDR